MIWSNTAQQNFIRKVIVSHLNWGGVNVIKDNKVFPAIEKQKLEHGELDYTHENEILVKNSHGLHFPMATPFARTSHTPRVVLKLFSVDFVGEKIAIPFHKVNT